VNTYADFNGSGTLQTRYLNGPAIDEVLARTSSGGTSAWYLADRLGSVRDVVNTSGTVIDHVAYNAYGTVTSETSSANGDRFKFAGREFDAAINLYYNRRRYYDAVTGRFISEDPSGFTAGDANLDRYVGNGPTDGRDPSGLDVDGLNLPPMPNVELLTDRLVALHPDDGPTLLLKARNYGIGVDYSSWWFWVDSYDYDKSSRTILINQYRGVYPGRSDRSPDEQAEALYAALKKYVGDHTIGDAMMKFYQNGFGNLLRLNHGVTPENPEQAATPDQSKANEEWARITGNILQSDAEEWLKSQAAVGTLSAAALLAKMRFAKAAKRHAPNSDLSAKLVHDKFVQQARPGAKERVFNTPWSKNKGLGCRKFDDFDDLTGTGFEGNTTPWSRMTHDQLSRKLEQVGSDFALLKTDPRVKRIVWFGTEELPTTGLGGQLRQALKDSGIPYWVVTP
jgi:RHS repeat-associated protein